MLVVHVGCPLACGASPPRAAAAAGGTSTDAVAPARTEDDAAAWGARLGIPVELMEQIPAGCTANWTDSPTAGGVRSLPSVYEQQVRSLRPGHPTAGPLPTPSFHTVAGPGDANHGRVDDPLLAEPLPAGASRRRRDPVDADDALLGSEDAGDDLLDSGDDSLSSDALLPSDGFSGSDPLSGLTPGTAPNKDHDARRTPQEALDPDPHEAVFLESQYPSAAACGKCHQDHYDQWRGSAHAYAAISPMFHAFEQTIAELSKGTVGHFCVRCHAPVATQLGLPRHASMLDAPRVLREGITCVACHRVREYYGKTNGARRIEAGDMHEPVSSAGSGAGIDTAIAQKDHYKLKTSPMDDGPGQSIHRGRFFFEPLSQSEFCAPCHQVAVHPGVNLEIVWAQYRNSPAAECGVRCQDCHMGAVPGKPLGFRQAQIATLSDKPYGEPQKQSNHSFWGPGSSIAHPGLFPQNEKADRWSPRQWLSFDWRSGWGTPQFEQNPLGPFPPPWDNADERRDARKVLEENFERLAKKRAAAVATMENAIRIGPPRWLTAARVGQPFGFQVDVFNESEGHNLPTASLGAQPQLWLNLALRNPLGQIVWQSGNLDDYGDLRDLNSYQVMHGQRPRDAQLFNLQTKFLITGVKGPDRELPLPLNVDFDQLPFLRPGTVPVSVLNHPPFIRMETRSIAPRGSRMADYQIPPDRFTMPGVYRLSIRMRSRMEPPYFMRFCNASEEMIRRMLEETLDIHARTFEILVQ